LKLGADEGKTKKNNNNTQDSDAEETDKKVTDSLIQWIANSLRIVFIDFINALFHLK